MTAVQAAGQLHCGETEQVGTRHKKKSRIKSKGDMSQGHGQGLEDEFGDLEQLFCHGGPGSLLHEVQLAEIFPDSKTFVDLEPVGGARAVLTAWSSLLEAREGALLSRQELAKFVEKHFSREPRGLEEWEPQDWQPAPPFPSVTEPRARQLCLDLNRLWRQLGRRAGRGAGTLLPLPRPVMVPGGRFREVYYWDSYWTVLGLLHCGMVETARGLVESLLSLAEVNGGLIPNGGRLYYRGRTQPPLAAAMVEAILEWGGSEDWAAGQAAVLAREWSGWVDTRAVTVQGCRLFRYNCQVGRPRPESYREDWRLASHLPPATRPTLWQQLRTAAESGWDFSSRWYSSPTSSSLASTQTSSVVPADLNSMLARGAGLLARLYALRGENGEAAVWQQRRDQLVWSIETLLWCEEEASWYDLDLQTGEQRRRYSASNFVPLWAGAVPGGQVIPHIYLTRQ